MKTPSLYKHQADYLSSHVEDKYYALFWEMGAGKTRATLETARILYEKCLIDHLLIIAPNGVHVNWTRRQVPIWLEETPTASITWSRKHSTKAFRQHVADVLASKDTLKIISINVEALSTKGGNGVQFIRQIIDRCGDRAILVVDESSTIKHPKANRSKVIVNLSHRCAYRRILTGTPITQSPFDIWSQGEALKKGIWGRNYYMFKQHYGQFRTARFGNRSFEECIGYRHLDEMREIMKPWCSEVIKSECLDLPPKVYEVVDVPMTTEQDKMYKEMREYFATQIEGELITVDNALTKLTKLHQIVTGHILDEDGTIRTMPHNRLGILRQILDELSCKTIIFCQYRQPIYEIMEELGDVAVEYSGRIDDETREANVDAFQSDPRIRYIVVSLQSSGAYGLDLYAAGAVIYYCNGYNLERRMQSEDRAHRPGQVHDSVVYIDMVSTGTVDENIQIALSDKIDIASQVTSLMKSWLRSSI